jgi:hypothetical protein
LVKNFNKVFPHIAFNPEFTGKAPLDQFKTGSHLLENRNHSATVILHGDLVVTVLHSV